MIVSAKPLKELKPENIPLIGDAPRGMKATRANNALFYPINPGDKDKSWKRFHDESFDIFTSGKYAGDYEKKLIAKFRPISVRSPELVT